MQALTGYSQFCQDTRELDQLDRQDQPFTSHFADLLNCREINDVKGCNISLEQMIQTLMAKRPTNYTSLDEEQCAAEFVEAYLGYMKEECFAGKCPVTDNFGLERKCSKWENYCQWFASFYQLCISCRCHYNSKGCFEQLVKATIITEGEKLVLSDYVNQLMQDDTEICLTEVQGKVCRNPTYVTGLSRY